MNYKTFETLRSFCRTDLAAHLDTPAGKSASKLLEGLHGPMGELQHEQETAMRLFQCKDLTPREKAAAHLLAVINNHRAITWHREPVTPDGRAPAAPLEPGQAAELRQETINAIAEYAPFVPEREAAILLTIGDKLEGLLVPNLYEQVQHALFGARFWVSRARIKKAIHPVELMAMMLEHHHGSNPEKAVWDWHKAIRAVASAGQITPRNDVSLMPLPLMREGFDWVLTLTDADKFVEPLGWSVSAYLEHVFNDCFPAAAPPAPVVAVGASDGVEPWKEKARVRALEIIKRDKEKDLYPSQENIADEIAKQFRKDGLTGADGKPLSGATIKRHALKNISSAIGKQLSTTIGRGK